MRVDDRPDDREADPEAVRFCRDKRREQRVEDLRRQARSGVAYRDVDVGVPDVAADRDVTPAGGVSAIASMAFITRLTSTCCRSTGSPSTTHGLED